MKFNSVNYYSILGVEKDASAEQIKRAYRALALHWHPDMHVDDTPEAQAEAEYRFKAVNEAYQVLGDPEMRRAYDSWMFPDEESQPPTGAESAQGNKWWSACGAFILVLFLILSGFRLFSGSGSYDNDIQAGSDYGYGNSLSDYRIVVPGVAGNTSVTDKSLGRDNDLKVFVPDWHDYGNSGNIH
ncbi:MAG: DnaJ domain-containing protein [Bacteroidales bacterium]|nr:DnaJ domain-containing protein [Bacteroidales bacterium]